MSTSSARLPAPKIHVACTCGKKYRVPVAKAGRKLTCKGCGETFRVPREKGVSERSRGDILAGLGIDPVAAEKAYKAEIERRGKKRVYFCTRCQGEIEAHELKGAYIAGELVCPGCRATDLVADRRAERDQDLRKARGGAAAVELISDHRDPKKALPRALGYGALFFLGLTLPLWAVFGLGLLKALGIGALVALVGGGLIYRTRA